MTSAGPDDGWPSMIRHIRDANKWSQWTFASEVGSSQETVSRWERGVVTPSRAKQARIEKIAEQVQHSSLNGIAAIVRLSPYPTLLCDSRDSVVAASASSGLKEGVPVVQQTPVDQRAYYKAFMQSLSTGGFWSEPGQSRLYQFLRPTGEVLSAVLVSIHVRGDMYAFVQATLPLVK